MMHANCNCILNPRYFMFHLGYYGTEGQLITDRIMTAKNYIQGPLFLDWISSLPIDYFLLPFALKDLPPNLSLLAPMKPSVYVNSVKVRTVAYVRLLRALQGYRLFLAGFTMGKLIFKSLTFITLVNVVPLMYLLTHVATCILAVYSCHWSVDANPERCPSTNILLNFGPLNNYEYAGDGLLPAPKNFDICEH